MLDRLPARGTLLNTLTVIVGSLIGLAAGGVIPPTWERTAITGIGLATLGIGISMFLKSKNPLIIVMAMVFGGLLGELFRISSGLAHLAEFARSALGAGSEFNAGLVTASVLFCIGPMTLLGCLEDGLERKMELLGLKSLLDGVASVFLAATLGIGVLFSAVVVLVFQGALTALASPLRGLRDKPELLSETTATGGLIMIAIGCGLTGIHRFASEVFLPSLAMAPLLTLLWQKIEARTRPKAVE